jgi:hypothetical protein
MVDRLVDHQLRGRDREQLGPGSDQLAGDLDRRAVRRLGELADDHPGAAVAQGVQHLGLDSGLGRDPIERPAGLGCQGLGRGGWYGYGRGGDQRR